MESYKPRYLYLGSRSLGLPFMEQVVVQEVGESDTYSLVSPQCCIGLHGLGFLSQVAGSSQYDSDVWSRVGVWLWSFTYLCIIQRRLPSKVLECKHGSLIFALTSLDAPRSSKSTNDVLH